MRSLKLCPHFLPGGRDECSQWYALNPTVVKFASIDLDWAHDADNRALVADAPKDCLVVGKLTEPSFSFEQGEPTTLAGVYAATFQPMIDALPRVDVWEGLNEVGIMPEETERMKRHAEFSAEFARQISIRGKRAGVGVWATGNPPSLNQWNSWRPALHSILDYNAIFSRHNYGPLNEFLGLRHRADIRAWNALGFYRIPVFISECGADLCGVPGWGAWRTMWPDIDGYYRDWIKPFTLAINEDPDVIGAALFTLNGGGGWNEYDVAHSGLLDLLRRDIGELQAKEIEPMPDGSEGFTFLWGKGANVDLLAQCFYAMQYYLTTHAGDITGFSFPAGSTDRWWAANPRPQYCVMRPEFGQWLVYWHSPDTSVKPEIFVNPVDWRMEVFTAVGDMVKVLDPAGEANDMWIMGAFAQPVVP